MALFIRTGGIARAKTKIRFAKLVYNMNRMLYASCHCHHFHWYHEDMTATRTLVVPLPALPPVAHARPPTRYVTLGSYQGSPRRPSGAPPSLGSRHIAVFSRLHSMERSDSLHSDLRLKQVA